MDLHFVTKNRHKVEEAEIALKGTGIKIHILEAEKKEPDDWKLEDVASKNSKRIADETGKVVIIEDTGVFFEAFEDFPGAKPKRWFEKLGYKGLLAMFFETKIVDGVEEKKEIKNRKAYFKTVIGYCEPGKEPLLFVGTFDGTIAKEVKGMDADVLPYERIFICKDEEDNGMVNKDKENKRLRYLYEYSREEKNKFSHRAKAFRKLKEYLLSK